MKRVAMFTYYDVCFRVWRVMFGSSPIDVRGTWSWESKQDLKTDLRYCGLKLGRNNRIESMTLDELRKTGREDICALSAIS